MIRRSFIPLCLRDAWSKVKTKTEFPLEQFLMIFFSVLISSRSLLIFEVSTCVRQPSLVSSRLPNWFLNFKTKLRFGSHSTTYGFCYYNSSINRTLIFYTETFKHCDLKLLQRLDNFLSMVLWFSQWNF